MTSSPSEQTYLLTKERYAALGLDTDRAARDRMYSLLPGQHRLNLLYVPALLLHVSRGVRWDSDHVVTLTDELQAIIQEIVLGGYLDRVHIGLDFFDASINRVAAWAIGARNALRTLLMVLLEPRATLRELEQSGNYTRRLALLEELKSLPFGAVWDYHCLSQNVPVGYAFMDEIAAYEKNVLSARG
jgi:L-rhamnose isomerase